MPVGVPRVAYSFSTEEDAQWVDLYNRMYRDGVLFLGADLDDELSNQIIGIMVFLSNENPYRDIFLYINSLGGAMVSGLGVYDTISVTSNRVLTFSIGTAASMASFILCSGEPGFRVALPHSRVMIHQPAGGANGQSWDITQDTETVSILRTRVSYIYSEITCQPIQQIWIDMRRDNFLRAREARKYGLVDHVVKELSVFEKEMDLSSPIARIDPAQFYELRTGEPYQPHQPDKLLVSAR